MTLSVHAQSAGLFVRGLTNLRAMLVEAEAQVDATGRGGTALLGARLDVSGSSSAAPADLHGFTLAAHVHWAAEGATLAIAHLLGAPSAPAVSDEASFADLHRRIDSTIASLRGVDPSDLETGLDREIVIELPRGTIRCDGGQFLVAYAIPHFYYHVSTAYGILRNQGVRLTMGDFLGDWGTS
ncbi:MAG: DUF1993 domain-containing protein [Microbacteriaceae bacterium]|nr:DUF1993 domain-containing protein [Microbacteriaceae bacterium]